MPRVSVVIPLYQTEAYIAEALGSVLAQSFDDFEVIVVDDGSRDQGPAIARGFNDARVNVVAQANRGLAGARNTGIRLATGEYIALLDADDVWEIDKLARHVAHLDADPSIDVSFSASRLIDENGADIGLIQSPRSGKLEPADFFCRNPVGNGSVPVARRRAFDAIAFYDEELQRTCWFDESFRQSEDVECWMRMVAGRGCEFAYLDVALTRYRVNSSGLSANVEQQLATWHRFRNKVATYAPDLVARHGRRAEAYQLRYLARRGIRSDRRALALSLAAKSIAVYPRILLEEPSRSLSTAAAALAKLILTGTMFSRLEEAALGYAATRPGVRL